MVARLSDQKVSTYMKIWADPVCTLLTLSQTTILTKSKLGCRYSKPNRDIRLT